MKDSQVEVRSHLTVDYIYTIPTYIKIRSPHQAPESLDGQVGQDDDEEGEEDQSVHLLSELGLPAVVRLVLVPEVPDQQQEGEDQYRGLNDPNKQIFPRLVLLHLRPNQSMIFQGFASPTLLRSLRSQGSRRMMKERMRGMV